MENENEKILLIAEELQNDCHNTATLIMDNSKLAYQDAVNVWTFKKLAEYEYRLNQLEHKY